MLPFVAEAIRLLTTWDKAEEAAPQMFTVPVQPYAASALTPTVKPGSRTCQ